MRGIAVTTGGQFVYESEVLRFELLDLILENARGSADLTDHSQCMAPYFHDGSAATLTEVIDRYDSAKNLQLTPQQKADLIEYLRSL